jgi:hypothetical protein
VDRSTCREFEMIKRILASGGIGISVIVCAAAQTAVTQQPKPAAAAKPWTPPKRRGENRTSKACGR